MPTDTSSYDFSPYPGGTSMNPANKGLTPSAPTLPTIPKVPTTNPDTSQATSYNSATQTYIDSQQKAASDAQAQETALKAQTPTAPTSLDAYLNSQGEQSVNDFTQNEWNQTGINPTDYFAQQKAYGAQISDYQKTIDTLTTQKDQQISDATGRPGQSIDFLNNETAQITRNYNVAVATPMAEQSRISALMASNSQNFTQAQSFVTTAVSQYTSVAQGDLKQFDDFITNNQTQIAALGKTSQDALKNAYDAAQADLAQQKQDLTAKLNMAVAAGLTIPTDQLSSMSLTDVAAQAAAANGKKNVTAQAQAEANLKLTGAQTQEAYANAKKTLSEANAKSTTNPIQAAVDEQNAKQNAADAQTVNSNYQTIVSIAKKIGKTPETMTIQDIKTLSNADLTSIGKALGRMQMPDVARAGGGTTNPLDSVGIAALGQQFTQLLGGKLYSPDKVLDAVKTAISLQAQRQATGLNGATQGQGSGFTAQAGGKTYTFPDQKSLDAFKKAAGL